MTESKRLGRILITLDRDFLYYKGVDLKNHPGVIIVSFSSVTSPYINKVCNKSFKRITNNFVKHSLVMVTESKITRMKEGVRTEKKL